MFAHTVAGQDLTERLRLAPGAGAKLAVLYTLDDLDELIGYIAADANHVPDAALQEALDALFERLKAEMVLSFRLFR